MENQTTIHFVRHGRARNPNKVYYGRLMGFPLDDEGRLQASAARGFFADKLIDTVYSSPQLRARETAQKIIEPHEGKFVVVSELLNEAYSPFDGCPKSVIEDRNWDVYTGVDPCYEQPDNVLARGQRFISEVRIGHPGQQIVAVTHGDLIAFLMLWARGILCTPQNKQTMYNEYLHYASVTTFKFEAEIDGKFLQMDYTRPVQKSSKAK